MKRSLIAQLGIVLTLLLLGLGVAGQYVLFRTAEPVQQNAAPSAAAPTPEERIARIGSLILRDKLDHIEEEALMLVLQEQWRQLGFARAEEASVTSVSSEGVGEPEHPEGADDAADATGSSAPREAQTSSASSAPSSEGNSSSSAPRND